jgi:malonyl-CoA/methylmalonyl-CoA synthetase
MSLAAVSRFSKGGQTSLPAIGAVPKRPRKNFAATDFLSLANLGQIDSDGCLRIVGRAKDVIISGGLNVYPGEVEAAIDALPGVFESAVIGLPHEDLGEGVAAIVVPAPGAVLDESSVQKALSKKLARFKLPKRVFFAAKLPRNTMRKVQKNLLRDTFGNMFVS